MVLPSETHKKKLTNCRTALQYLKQAGVALNDDDGTEIVGEDVALGDKELVISLLWNVFVHLQVGVISLSRLQKTNAFHVNRCIF